MNSVVFLDVGFLFSGSPGDISVYNEMSPLSFALCCFNVNPPPLVTKTNVPHLAVTSFYRESD